MNSPRHPSVLYRAGLWKFALAIARRLSHSQVERIASGLAALYWRLAPSRRETVIQNLLPVLDNDRTRAKQAARELFKNFGRKLADLWRYEAGLPIESLFGEWSGWEYFEQARATGRGILLVTPHLGNWEFGAPPLARRNLKLLVITLAEPNPELTEMRKRSRANWGIETLVIGSDPFAFVEIIRRLESGAIVALLVDRPPAASAVEIRLFGRPFHASIAAAELARASGCIILPVCLPWTPSGYAAQVLPSIPYERPGLRDLEARRRLTQATLSAFEPVIRQYANQWYHFVPVWP